MNKKAIIILWWNEIVKGFSLTGEGDPPNDVRETRVEIPYWWHVTTQIWVVLLIGRAAWEIWFNQSETLPSSGKWRVISMEFLRSFLRLHLAGKPVVASPNVDCFLRLLFWRTNFKSGIRSCSQFKKDTLMSPKCVMRGVDLFAGTRALSVHVAAHSRPRNEGLWGREW